MEIKPIGAGGIYSPSALRSGNNGTNGNDAASPQGIRLNDRYESSTVRASEKNAPAEDKNTDKVMMTTVNTDKVDRELDHLKEKKQDLEQAIIRANGSHRGRQLERTLKRLNSEISRRDNDAYRRQHSEVTTKEQR